MNVFGALVSRVESTHVVGDSASLNTSSVVYMRSPTLIEYFRIKPPSTAVQNCFPPEHAATTGPSMPVRELTSAYERILDLHVKRTYSQS
jgi:hypothetical protein